jgi:tetratricopeptide (TPR) repeat protein
MSIRTCLRNALLCAGPCLGAVAQAAGAADPCDYRALDEAIRRTPKDADRYVDRAVCHLRNGPNGSKPPMRHADSAMRDLEQAIRLDPRHAMARHQYGRTALLYGNTTIASAEFSKAIALEPKLAHSYLGRGWALLQSCRPTEAAPDFERAVKLDASLRSALPDRQTLAAQQSACTRPATPAPRPQQGKSPWSPSDPYFDRNSDYWRQRNWENRPH